ncbi:MAG: EAL domain-containing protein [Pseudomonadota bacterium]
MSETLFSGQTILLANSLLVSLLLFALWISDREQRHNLYWGGGLFAMFVVLATLPTEPPDTLSAGIALCVIASAVACTLLVQGTATFANKSLSARWLIASGLALILLFVILALSSYQGGILLATAVAAAFWFTAWTLRTYGFVEKIAAALFFIRGFMLVLAALTAEFSFTERFLNLSFISANQIVAMASALALLMVAFLANQRELERSRRLLRQGNLMAQRLGQLSDTASVVRESVKILLEEEPLSTAWIYRLDEKSQKLWMLDSGGRLAYLSRENTEIPLEGSVSGKAVHTGRVQLIDDLASDARVNRTARKLAHTHPKELAGTNIIIPLMSGDRVYGTCSYHLGLQRTLNQADFEAFEAIGQIIGLALASVDNLEEMTFRANHDSLTQLPNRAALHEAFRQHAKENPAHGATMFLLDLDKFKDVNDTLGHHVGDQLLKEIGPRLAQVAAPSKLMAARLGGDEFVCLLFKSLERAQATQLGREILEAVRARFSVDDLSLSIDGSIGISAAPRDGEDSHELLRCADVAMYQAKTTTTPVVAYNQSFDPHSRERLALMSELKASIGSEQLILHYQPKVHLASNRVSGVEALLRWKHPVHGMISPGTFIPMAEVSPMINELSLWVMEQAIAQAKLWSDLDLSVAINVSMRNLAEDTWYERAIGLIRESGIPAGKLELELTESVFMHAPDEVGRKLNAIAATGVRIAIDDFGTGYSSLNYLRKLPIHVVKIDKSFVMQLHENKADRQIVETILSLAEAMKLEVIAEGVEQEESLQLLRELGCDYVQGFHVGHPTEPTKLTTWIKERQWEAKAYGNQMNEAGAGGS